MRIHRTSAALAMFALLSCATRAPAPTPAPAVAVPSAEPAPSTPAPERLVLTADVLDESGGVVGEAPKLAERLAKCAPTSRGWAIFRYQPGRVDVQESATLDATQLSCFERAVRELGQSAALQCQQLCLIYVRVG